MRSPAPEAGVSTNFTIWAVSATLSVVDGAHYTERLFNCKPPEVKKTWKISPVVYKTALRCRYRALDGSS
ncbi:hypothetical protein EMIT0P4_20411 [Pseudomonas sp. IT-P4]